MTDADLTVTPKEPAPDPAREFFAALLAATPRTYVTTALLLANIAVFGWVVADGISVMEPSALDLLERGANYGPKTLSSEPWRLFTSMFLHGGLIHLAFNMFVLWQGGALVERLYGNVGFLVLYVVAGLAGSLASAFWHPALVSVGASGAIFGVYGALLATLVVQRGTIPAAVLAQQRSGVIAFVGYNLVYGMFKEDIDMAAHVGGLVAGFGFGFFMSLPLGPDGASRRPGRNLLAAIGGAALVYGALRVIPVPTVDFLGMLTDFDAIERAAVADFDAAVEAAQSGSLSDAAFAERLETKVLPPMVAWYERAGAATGLPTTISVRLKWVMEYADARIRGWQMLARGVRDGDEEVVKAAGEIYRTRAEEIMANPPK